MTLARFIVVILLAVQVTAKAQVRIEQESTHYPWSAIGKLESEDVSKLRVGTATLVAPDLIVTAAHLVIDEHGNPRDVRFYPNQLRNSTPRPVKIERLFHSSQWCNTCAAADFAILKLREPVGHEYGTMDLSQNFFENRTAWKNAIDVTKVGYAIDFQDGKAASVSAFCHVLGRFDSLLVHDCETSAGDSGAPLFQMEQGRAKLMSMHIGRKGRDALAISSDTLRKFVNSFR